jgi:hypothetical protein
MFALDVFGEKQWFLALIIHLIPTYVAVILTVIAWKREFLGGILWIMTALLVILTTRIGLIITLPMVVIGGLNLWMAKVTLKKKKFDL